MACISRIHDVIVFCAGFCGTRILAPEVVLCFVKRFHNCAVPFNAFGKQRKGKIASVSNLLLKPVTHPIFGDDYA
ncbi:hypothetical protein VTP01DRAFT_1531 [Rhizomucor pusillus]|uniref:uncharacterized protein n=1 Tax=Rhizomucor pusillus TaxID=4840 RepID=UPI0037439E48